MKHFNFLFVMSCITIAAVAQDSTRFSFGFKFSPDYSFRILKNDAAPGSTNDYIYHLRDSLEIPKLSYTAGFGGLFKFSKHLQLEFGIYYSIKGEKTKDYEFIAVQSNDPLAPKTMSFKYNTTYLDIPLKINFTFLSGNFKPFVTAGISPSVFLFERHISKTTFESGDIKRSTSISYKGTGYYIINPQILLGAGIYYQKGKFNFQIEPVYRRSLIRVNKGSIYGYFYSIGIETGMFYSFK
jgi:hypothetical protein